ncbi:hypothetical protein [uncultured Methanospirillum sp.]|uniref:hypothetical protein n=1 Tax=uncultured Methanospirillum sp. TaxID=262503 RepID=UPI0029C67BF2|nr:hypothetical protein [uncultured Methanospirillum sp.]
MKPMVCICCIDQACLRVPVILLILLFLTVPVPAVGIETPETSSHSIGIEYPNIITPEMSWHKCLNTPLIGSSYIVQQTSDGGYLMFGRSESKNATQDENRQDPGYWIVKLNPGGDIVWQKIYRGRDRTDSMAVYQSYSCGYDSGGISGTDAENAIGNMSTDRSWVAKFTHDGDISWKKDLGSAFHAEIHSIQQTGDAGYIIAGNTGLPGGDGSGGRADRDYWIGKMSPSGEITWKKTFGGTKDDLGYCIRQTIDGGYIVVGASASDDGDVTGNHGDFDYWVVKLTPNLEISWQKSLGGSKNDTPSFVQQLSDGGYIIAGASASNDGDVTGNHGDLDYWLVKLTPGGELSWQKSYGGKADDEVPCIRQTRDGGYIVVGQSESRDGDVTGNHGNYDYWVIKLATDGALKWEKCFGGNRYDAGQSVVQTSDGGFVVAGISSSHDGDLTGITG